MTSPQKLASLLDLSLVGRHQTAALLATIIDFATMIALVEAANVSPPAATLASAFVGGLANFVVSRVWAFRGRHEGTVRAQAARYAFVSLGGALLNAALLAAILRLFVVPYPAARGLIAILVSILYTYPLHARVVFRLAA